MYFAMFTLTMFYFRYSSCDQIWGHMVHTLCLQHLGQFMHFAMFTLTSFYFRHSLCDQKWRAHSATNVFTILQVFIHFAIFILTSFYIRHSLCDQEWGPHSVSCVVWVFSGEALANMVHCQCVISMFSSAQVLGGHFISHQAYPWCLLNVGPSFQNFKMAPPPPLMARLLVTY